MIKRNPITGLMEDDGLPDIALDGAAPALVDPAAAELAAPAPPGDLQGVQPGTGIAPPAVAPVQPPGVPMIPAASIFPAKPEHTVKVDTVVKTDDARKADEAQAEARGERDAAQVRDAEIKRQEAEAKLEDAKLARLEVEKKHAAEAYWEDQKRRKVEDNMSADKAAIAESTAGEKAKNEAGVLVGAAKAWSTVLTAIGTIGQGLAAAGSRGAQAWADGNPIAKLYEEERQKAQAKAKAEFESSERYRALKKAGRESELKDIEDRLTIGVNNQFRRDKELREGILNERIAKLGPKAAQTASELVQAGSKAADAAIDQENAFRYGRRIEDTRNSPTAPAGGPNARPTWVADPKTGEPIAAPLAKPEEVEKAHAGYAALTGLRDWKGRMVAFVHKNGVTLNDIDPDTSPEYGALRTEAAGYLTKLNESGVLNEGEFKRYSDIIGPAGLKSLISTKGGVSKGLDAVLNGAEGRYRGTVKSLVPEWGKEPTKPKSEQVAKMNESVGRMSARAGGKAPPAAGPTKTYRRKDGTTFQGRLNAQGKIEEVGP